MSTYLDRLKRLDEDKYFQHTPDIEPTKPTKGAFDGFDGTGTGLIEKNLIESANDTQPKTDCIDTLETDYAELKTFIAELCRIAGHPEEAKENMLAACRKITPAEISDQRDYFRQQVEIATAGRYWSSKAIH